MSIPKFAGIETEFAITGGDPQETSAEVVSSYLHLLLDDGESTRSRPANPFAGSKVDMMLPNGSRYYVDHAHPEYSTPESSDARTVVALERAGVELVRRCVEAANQIRQSRLIGTHRPIRIYKNNSDHRSHSYGCHENYLVDASTYRAMFGRRAHWLFVYLIPFLVSRIVMIGSGKVGAENGGDPTDFQISQRADFFEELVGLQTTYSRPIVNTRDEPHADPLRFRRLHVIAGDANMCPYAAWLKIGTMQIVLRLLEDGAINTTNLLLADPLVAVRELSRDTSCKRPLLLEDGRALTAVEIQTEFLDRAHTYFARHAANEGEALVLQHWELVLALLAEDPDQLVGSLDWVTKRQVLSDLAAQHGWDWASPNAIEADVKYHALAPEESIFQVLERQELIQYPPGWDSEAELLLLRTPPADSRALLRGWCIGRFAQDVRSANWSEVVFRKRKLLLPELAGPDEAAVASIADQCLTFNEVLDALSGERAATDRESAMASVTSVQVIQT